MNKWGKISTVVRGQICPNLRVVMDFVLQFFDISLICGERGEAEQNAAFYGRPQRSKVKFPKSKHNKKPGRLDVDAVDFELKGADKEKMVFLAGFVVGVGEMLFRAGEITQRIKSLGPTKLGDYYHIEMR